MFARRNNQGNFDLFHDSGEDLTIAPEGWPIVWPVGSDLSAFYEHPKGITLSPKDYAQIRNLVPIEDNSTPR